MDLETINHTAATQSIASKRQGNAQVAEIPPRELEASEAVSSQANIQTEPVKSLQEVVDNVSDYVQNVQRQLSFSVEKESGKTVIRVVDSATDELIRQIPTEEFLELAKALEKAKGILLREEV